MTETVLWDADPEDANWISELQRAKGRIPEPEPTPTTVAPTAASLTPVEMAYSPNQPRKPDGKFGTGGARGGSSGSGGTAGSTPDGDGNRGKLQDGFDAETQKARDFLEAPELGRVDDVLVAQRASRQLKDQAMRAMGADLDAQFDANRLAKCAEHMGDAHGGFQGDTNGELVADAMLATWQSGAYGLDKPDTVAMQIAIGREFKTGVGVNIQKDFDEAGQKTDAWGGQNQYDMEVIQAGVRSMYNHTQARLDELGVKGDITLHRGVGREIRGDSEVDFNPASSWSTDKATADTFADNQAQKTSAVTNDAYTRGTRLTMTVPRERVLSMPGHGIGCFEEGEVVVLRSDGDMALGNEPRFDVDPTP